MLGKEGPRKFTEAAGVVVLDKTSLGYSLEETYTTHVIQVSALGGGNVDVAVSGPGGIYTTVATGLVEGKIITISPQGVTVIGGAQLGPRGTWRRIRLTFNATAGAGVAHVESLLTQMPV